MPKPTPAVLMPHVNRWHAYGPANDPAPLYLARVHHQGITYLLLRDAHGHTVVYDPAEAATFTDGAQHGEFDTNHAEQHHPG